jgi:hypothetical protein
MAEKYRYRTLMEAEEHPRERWLANRALRLFSKKLGIPEVRLSFIEPGSGPHTFDANILGFYYPSGEEIGIRRGLSDRDLILVVAHETRHAFQKRAGRRISERDAAIYEFEVNPPRDRDILHWLNHQEVQVSPELRDIYERADRLLQHSRGQETTPTQTFDQHGHEIAAHRVSKMRGN